eukprot:gene8502-29096_t
MCGDPMRLTQFGFFEFASEVEAHSLLASRSRMQQVPQAGSAQQLPPRSPLLYLSCRGIDASLGEGELDAQRICGDASRPHRFGFFEFESPRQAQALLANDGAQPR